MTKVLWPKPELDGVWMSVRLAALVSSESGRLSSTGKERFDEEMSEASSVESARWTTASFDVALPASLH